MKNKSCTIAVRLAVIAALALVLTLIPPAAFDVSAEPMTSGTIGFSVYWDLDIETDTLTISGRGDIYDFDFDSQEPLTPGWFDSADTSMLRHIKYVVINNGVTGIGANLFKYCDSMETISLPAHLTKIGENAFFGCGSLKSVALPPGLEAIPDNAFAYCEKLKHVGIPASVTSIGAGAFRQCSSLEVVAFEKGSRLASAGASVFQESLISAWENGRTIYWYASDTQAAQVISQIKAEWDASVADMAEIHPCNWHWNAVADDFLYQGPDFDPEPVSLTEASVSLVKSAVWTGKAIRPAPKVVCRDIVLTKGTDYSVRYSNNKNVGTATVTITGKGCYTGTVKKTFSILPRGTSVTKVTGGVRSITVKWKKQTSQTDGYLIQTATNRTFSRNTKATLVKSNRTTSKTISKLKRKTRYYARVRTWKRVRGKTYYSQWSNVKSAKTRQ